VVDGTYITEPELNLGKGPKYNVNVMQGITRDDGAPFIAFPSPSVTNYSEYLTSVELPVPEKKGLFPVASTGNFTKDIFFAASRIATDGVFRCIDQATTKAGLVNGRFDKVWYYEFDRTYREFTPYVPNPKIIWTGN
jgi:hypothetical protein